MVAKNEADGRLAGDPVSELQPVGPAQRSIGLRDYRRWLAVACLIAAGWLPSPPLAVLTAFLAVAARGFQTGRQLSRSIPDKAGGAVCARFVHAWGAWKLGWAAFALMFITAILSSAAGNRCEPPPEFMAAAWLWMGGVATAAVLTDPGMLKACRSVMRVWAGDGVNGPGRSC